LRAVRSSLVLTNDEHVLTDPARNAFASALSNFHVFPALTATFQLGLFEFMKGNNVSFSTLQRELNVSAKGLDALVTVLVPMELLKYDPVTATFTNHPTIDEMMGTNELHEIATWFLGYSVSTQRQFYFTAESVRLGRAEGLTKVLGDYPSLYEARAHIPEVAKYWDPFMQLFDDPTKYEDVQKILYYALPALRGKLMRKEMSTLMASQSEHRFNGRVLDWCGNTGGNAIELASRDPTLNITVLDLPAQCEKAQTNIQNASLEAQIDTLPQDLLDASFRIDRKFDAVMMVHTIREWSPEHLQHFFHLIYDALNPGGVVFMDMVCDRKIGGGYETIDSAKNNTNPGKNAMYFLVGASNEQYQHTDDELGPMLVKAGFQHFRNSELTARGYPAGYSIGFK